MKIQSFIHFSLGIGPSVGLLALGFMPATAQSKPPKSQASAIARSPAAAVRLQFANTDVSDVLQAIALKTHANIVYATMAKRSISLNITADSVGEAIGFAASAAGLTYTQMGRKYFVGSVADLRQLVESFGTKQLVDLDGISLPDAVALLNGAFPYLTVRPAGQQILAIGSMEDIAGAETLLARQVRPAALPVRSEIVPVLRLNVTETATMIQALYPGLKAEGVTGMDKSGGSIGLSGLTSQVDAAKEALIKMDSRPPSSALQQPIYQIYAVRYSSAPALRAFLEKTMPGVTAVIGPEHYSPPAPGFQPLSGAISGNVGGSGGSSNASGGASQGGSGGGASGGSQSAQAKSTEGDRSAMLVVSGPAAEVDAAIHLLTEVDIAPKQVLVEVKVVDLSPERAEALGVAWNWSALNFLEHPVGTLLSGAAAAQSSTVPKAPGYFSRVPFTFGATLNAMITNNEAKILANPRIQVLDNDDANIFIGDTLRTQVSQSGIAGTTVQVFEFPIGIILLVRPRVNADGQITMRVHPAVSTVTGIGAGNLPQTSTREAETTVRVHDGETVVIGGLIRDEMSKVVQEVPFLSKLPIIGQLFRSTSTDHRHSEIMVFITPHILK